MKLGLGESYDKVLINKKARAYLDLTKPASSVGVAVTYLIASLFYFYYIGSPELIGERFTTIIYAVVTIGLAHGASQAMNMAEDADMDCETPHKQNRPIPAGIVSEEEARTIAWFLMIFAVGRAYMTNSLFGVFVSALVVFGIFYNLSPIRAKERIISIPWQAVSRGLLSFPTVWAAYGDPWKPTPWILGIFMFFYVFGFQNSADIIDKEIDEKYGIKTFTVVFGVKKIPYIAAGSMMMMVATIITGIYSGFIEQKFIYMLLIMPFCIIMLYHLTYHPYSVSEKTGNHPAWLWFYMGMVLTVSIPLGVEVIMAS